MPNSPAHVRAARWPVILKLWREGKTITEIATELGLTFDLAKNYISRLQQSTDPEGYVAQRVAALMPKRVLIPVAAEVTRPEQAPHVVDDDEMVERLQASGWRVTKEAPVEQRIRIGKPNTKHHRFAVVGDTHLGSRCQQLTLLHRFYDKVVDEGITTVFHVGDLVHGSHKMHRDMPFELHVHGADAQTKYAVDHYPRKPGVTTHFITGNHDDSHWNDAGTDVVRSFCGQRDDARYLGVRGAYIEFGGVNVYLWHPKSGPAYARSYKLQKWIEGVSADEKPHMVFTGHWHIANHLPAYRNVEGFLTPCWQSQTPFEKTLGLQPVIGGLIIDLWTAEDGIEDLRTRWCLERVTIAEDY